ncbi:PREDICTED: protein ripply3 [Miniopterus natalensis]|uniref:protein ripply3 n=1 Tax=Miniopterus natalensis TaxID=291302 RepID=UPI0007A6B056|nr:PREDICTED: protein ripply3 [Miniopterus natalensis]
MDSVELRRVSDVVCTAPSQRARPGPVDTELVSLWNPGGWNSPTPWRPWILTPRDAGQTRTRSRLEPGGDRQTSGSKGAFGFQHPVRLYLPISKRQEYLQSSGERVLASFPVQATIHFYNDESDSEDGGPEEEARLLPREAEGPGTGPGPRGGDPQARWAPASAGHGRPSGQGRLPLGDCPGGAWCSSSK